jgi:hypothetical protein
MNADLHSATVMICCSVLQAEVKALWEKHWMNHLLYFETSMLHIKPGRLATLLDSLVEKELGMGHRVVLVYGDCCTQMAVLEARPEVVRTRANNCCELLLGKDEYLRLSHEGAFFLFPEWTRRWKEIFTFELGLNRDNATSLMQDMHSKMIYLDTGLVPVPENDLQACAQYCGLTYEVRPTSLEHLRAAIQEALLRLEIVGGPA